MRIRRRGFLILLSATVLANPLSAQSVWTIPGTVNAAGQNNTRFVSDLAVTNPGTTATQVTISFFPFSSPNPRTVTLNAGETIVYRNVVESLFGASGAGALSISSGQPLLLRARTYNTASSGTYGVALPVYEAERFLTAGEVGDTVWVSQDASGSSGYRTNIAVVFPDETGGAATVTVYDAEGNQRGHKDYTVETAGLQQFSVGSFAGAVSVGRAQIHVTRGRAAGYSVVVDNVTGDSSLFTFEDLPGGRQDVLVNGVARANGRNGTFFRTDGRFYNPTDTDATVQVSFHASGNSNPSPASASFTLPAGKIRDVVDVLQALLGLPVGSSGALRFTSDWPVAILCRTSNVDPSGARPGTFGAQQKPVPILSFLTSADAGASITGIRQDTSYRTNVGFAAGEEGARYTLTLTTAGGATVATASGSLGGNGWSQPNVQELFPGTSIPSDATLKVKVTEGSLDVYDSSIDNLSGDSVVTPIATLPADIPASATIGPAGGSIRSSDGRLTLRIPAGALTLNVVASVETSATNDAPQGSGASYAISPGDLDFAKPATLVFRYDSEDLAGSSSGALGLAFQSGGRWYVATGGAVNAAERTLTVPITSIVPAAETASSSPQPLAAPSNAFWAPFTSLRIGASSRGAIPTGGRANLGVHGTTRFSSSGRSRPGSSPLSEPANLADLHYVWFVNGVVLGDSTVGRIDVSDHGWNVHYTAPPSCPPGNPVSIAVKIWSDRSYPVAVWLILNFRILPREWNLTATKEFQTLCSGGEDVDDYVKYEGGFSFRLDDAMNVESIVPIAPVHSFRGDPVSCDPSFATNFRRKAVDDLLVGSSYGFYDSDKDRMHLSLNFAIPGPPGYDFTYNDGNNTPGVISPGPTITLPTQPVLLPRKGRVYFQVGYGPVASIVVLELQSKSCP